MPSATPWFTGLVWQSGTLVALQALDALTTIWALSAGAVELNGVAAFLLSGGPVPFLAVKLLFATWVVVGLAWVGRDWSPRHARTGVNLCLLLMVAVVSWNATMLAILPLGR